jgi:hypothetical protein
MKITEIQNTTLPPIKKIEEKMSVFIPGVNNTIPNRNGNITVMCGPPGSGKTNLLMNMFLDKNFYKQKFNNVYLISPESSFLSVKNHPFKDHDKVHFELTEDLIDNIYDELLSIKKETKKIQYSLLIVDDFAADIKQKSIQSALKRLLVKSRHVSCSVIFTLQSFNLMPLTLRKLVTNLVLFKPKNNKETESLNEILNMKQDEIHTLLRYGFDELYNFLSIDTNTNEVRKNWNLLQIDN